MTSTVRELRPLCWTVDTGSGGGPTAPTVRTLLFAAEGDPAKRPTKCQLLHPLQVRDEVSQGQQAYLAPFKLHCRSLDLQFIFLGKTKPPLQTAGLRPGCALFTSLLHRCLTFYLWFCGCWTALFPQCDNTAVSLCTQFKCHMLTAGRIKRCLLPQRSRGPAPPVDTQTIRMRIE